jgi:hypothetical protein
LSSHAHLCFTSSLFSSGFPINILYVLLISHMHATCPTNLILLNFITHILDEEYKLWSSLLHNILQPPDTSSLIGPNILLSTLFPNTLNLSPSHRVRDQVFYTHIKQ